MEAKIILEDGTVFVGKSFGAIKTVCGEIVFNTSMTGYQEILTDPSYAGQIVIMTYPLIGNYGINDEDFESDTIQVTGFIVKEHAKKPSHWQNQQTLDDYLKVQGIPGIYGVDTRKLTKKIRTKGTMACMITQESLDETLWGQLKRYSFPKDIVSKISCRQQQHYPGKGPKVALIDLGLKQGILKQLLALDCQVTVFPHHIASETLLHNDYEIILFSNGPGDPKEVKTVIQTARQLIGKKTLWGICLGHQVLALAFGAETYKLKFGHRGGNHPVMDLVSGKVFMSSQNHGYAVEEKNLPKALKVTHRHINDKTIEGIVAVKEKVRSVQFHPEEGPGPEDAHGLFKQWLDEYKKDR